MIKVELTEEQLDDLKSILDYVCEVNSEHYIEMEEEYGPDNERVIDHVYNLANNLRALTWSKV
jgi:hypothetical protein